jgi:hypothetical protein
MARFLGRLHRVVDVPPLALGCVPVIISDNTHVPFTSSINWNAFTVAIPELAILQVSPSPPPPLERVGRVRKSPGGVKWPE